MNKKLKIAIIGSRGYPYVYSGYETLVKELSERLVKKGHLVRVYCHRSLFKKKPKNINGIELVYTPSVNSKIFSQLFNSFFSFIHVCFSNVDIILVVNSANGPFGILTKIFGKRTCINVDGLEWLRPKWKGLGSLYFTFSSKLSTLFFDKIITDSIEMSKIYLKKFKKQSIVIAYGSTMIKNKKVELIKKYNLSPNEFYLIVGRLIPDNNSKLIIQGFIKSKSKKKLVIIGDVPYKDNYAIDVKSYSSSRIIFTGYVNDQKELSSFFNYSYGYIHGHEFGGTNPTMINALDSNCQIIALNTVFNNEMLKDKKSIYFEKNLKSISDAIDLFEAKYEKITMKNLDYRIPKKYNWDYIVEQYLQAFNQLSN